MRTPDELDRLLDATLTTERSDDARRATLNTGLAALQRRNRRRQFQRRMLVAAPVVLLLIALTSSLISQPNGNTGSNIAARSELSPEPDTIPGTPIRIISDDELFALFPDRPLALIGPKGNQQLVFLDEPRSIEHLQTQ
jgi:hypothetical protein